MSAYAAFLIGVVICVLGLALAAYLVDVPLAWIAAAVAAMLIAMLFVTRKRARRAR
ncbi:MAG TPA: hypothetical protein VIC55_10460 [Gemmatimonadaceae bacterium]|jgi:ABC-type Mn2+/Zn2+ transport system permease subunit